MNKENCNKLLKSIQFDDVEAFSSLLELSKNLNICFGRFPVLSLCYMYNAKKIIKKYEKNLILISNFEKIDEPIQLYMHFRQFAGKCLRLYGSSDSIVTPIEMLAILHCDVKVKKFYGNFSKNTECVNNLFKIYSGFYGQKIFKTESGIAIGSKIKSIYQQKQIKFSVLFLSIFMFLSLSLFFIFDAVFGLNIMLPQKIYNEKQFNLALNSNESFCLNNDLTINIENPIESFTGQIDGNNKTIFIDFSETNDSLIKNNYGTLKNLNIVYKNVPENINLNTSMCLLCFNNFATIKNVNLSFSLDNGDPINLTVNKSANSTKYFCGFSVNNSGTIENSVANLNILAVSNNENGDAYISCFVGENTGSITGCKTANTSTFETTDIDVCGIAIKNQLNATVFGCENNAKIKQVTTVKMWSPTVGGIVCVNNGVVDNCLNKSELVVESDVETETGEDKANAFVGGIVALNYKNISKCRNTGNIKVAVKDFTTFVGGIAGYSSYYEATNNVSIVTMCISDCNILVDVENAETDVYVGGFCGFMYGNAVQNVSIATFENGYSEEGKRYVGLAFGLIWYQVVSYWGTLQYIDGSQNYVLIRDNVSAQLGAMISLYGTDIQAGKETASGEAGQVVKTLSTLEGIKALEEWYE